MEMNGQLLPISNYDELFNLIGTTFGGDGQSTFALPDMRSRVIVGVGQGPGLSPRVLGEQGGSESETMTTAKMPTHTHTRGVAPPASVTDATFKAPAGAVAASKARTTLYAPGPGDVAMQGGQTSSVGGSGGGTVALENRQPTLAVKCVIAVFGFFPSQN